MPKSPSPPHREPPIRDARSCPPHVHRSPGPLARASHEHHHHNLSRREGRPRARHTHSHHQAGRDPQQTHRSPRPPASLSVFLPDILTLRSVVSRTASAHPEVAVGANVLGTLAVRAAGHDTDIVASWKDARRGASVRLLRLLSRPKGKAYDSEDEVDVLTPALFRLSPLIPDPPHLHPTALRFVSMPSSVLDRILRCFYGEVTAVVCLHRDAGLGLHLYQGPRKCLPWVSVGDQRRSVSSRLDADSFPLNRSTFRPAAAASS